MTGLYFTWFDGIVIVLLLYCVIHGVFLGFVRQIAALAALVLGFIAAGSLHRHVYVLLRPSFDNAEVTFFVVYFLLFFAVYSFVILLGKGAQKVMTVSFQGWFDRLLGGLMGFAKAFLVSTLLFMVVAGFTGGSNEGLRRSFCYPTLRQSSVWMLQLLKNDPSVPVFFRPLSPPSAAPQGARPPGA